MTRFAFETLHQEALRAIEAEGLRPFARRTGIALGIIRSLVDGRDLSVSNTLALVDALGFNVSVSRGGAVSGFSEGEAATDLGKKETLRAGFLPIPWHPEAGRQGSAPVAFSHDWLASQGLIPDFLRAAMPNFADSSFAMAKNTVAILQVNAARKGAGSIWCYRDGMTIGMARVIFVDGAAAIVPSAEASQTLVIPKEATPGLGLLGKVVWFGQTP